MAAIARRYCQALRMASEEIIRGRNACGRAADYGMSGPSQPTFFLRRPTRFASARRPRSAKQPCTRGTPKRRRPVAERPSSHRTGKRLVRPCRTSLAHQSTGLRPFSGTYACRAETAMGRTAYGRVVRDVSASQRSGPSSGDCGSEPLSPGRCPPNPTNRTHAPHTQDKA
jgi:hypothetical protein